MPNHDINSANNLISEMGLLLNLPGLKLNEHGVACLVADKKLSVNIEFSESESVFHIYAVLLKLSGPLEDNISLCKKVMSMNAYGNQTAGNCIAWDESHHELIICNRIDIDICSPEYLRNKLESFMDQVEYWIEHIKEFDSNEAGEENSEQQNSISSSNKISSINMIKG